MTDRDPSLRVTASPLGSLAAELVAAERLLVGAHRELENLLDSLYGAQGWQEYEVGADAVIDVYGVTPAPAAVHALELAGFARVYEHEHEARRFATCACRARG